MNLSVGFSHPKLQYKAHQIAGRLNLLLNNTHYPRLQVTDEGIELLIAGFKPLYIDFADPRLQRRSNEKGKQGLLQACKPTPGMKIIDATAGWGRDASLLANAGAQVCMLERSEVVGLLLEDGLNRMNTPTTLQLIICDAKVFLENLPSQDIPQLIYIDPMHPERQKSALVKKEMQVLQELLGPDYDAAELLEIALHKSQKVVVKWPQKAQPLRRPNYSINGKTVRFDVYKA
jgi:16S rRNA (guanine1516-N2)-methyltransferase